jgi:hypothetical protein
MMAVIGEKLGKDIVTAMKAREQETLTTLRMVKSALKNKEIDKREPLTDAEEQSILTTMLKQRRESIEQFTKVEIGLIEAYMPKAASEDDLRALVAAAVAQVTTENGGTKPGPKEMGSVMKAAQAKIAASGARADGKLVSELVKAELAKG